MAANGIVNGHAAQVPLLEPVPFLLTGACMTNACWRSVRSFVAGQDRAA
jgi:hypothetical protein